MLLTSPAIWHLECGHAIEIHDTITFIFYMGLAHFKLDVVRWNRAKWNASSHWELSPGAFSLSWLWGADCCSSAVEHWWLNSEVIQKFNSYLPAFTLYLSVNIHVKHIPANPRLSSFGSKTREGVVYLNLRLFWLAARSTVFMTTLSGGTSMLTVIYCKYTAK